MQYTLFTRSNHVVVFSRKDYLKAVFAKPRKDFSVFAKLRNEAVAI